MNVAKDAATTYAKLVRSSTVAGQGCAIDHTQEARRGHFDYDLCVVASSGWPTRVDDIKLKRWRIHKCAVCKPPGSGVNIICVCPSPEILPDRSHNTRTTSLWPHVLRFS